MGAKITTLQRANTARGMVGANGQMGTNDFRNVHDVVTEWPFTMDPDIEVFTEGTHRTLLQETLDTHKAVLEAIKCGDSTWARDAMTLHLSYNRDLYRKMHRAHSGEPPLAPKVPEWVLQLKELTKPEEPEEKE